MSTHYTLAVLAAMTLFFAAATSSAQDKPNSIGAGKPNAGASSTSKPTKSAKPAPSPANGVNSNAATERPGTGTPSATQTPPVEERTERSCHSRDSDA
jgi:hypothetical protein